MNRKGYSLIELMVVMSIASVVMGVSAGWIHQSMKAASIMRDRERQHSSFLRLSRSLRDHVHQGQSIQIDNDNQLVIEGSTGNVVTFKITDQSILMHSRIGDDVVAQESFTFSTNVSVRWDRSEIPDAITLLATRTSLASRVANRETIDPDSIDQPTVLCVRASPNRWQQLGIERLAAREGTSE